MSEQDYARNVKLYYAYALFNEPLFWGPILVLSLQKLAGMSLADIFYMEAIVLAICVVLDIPSGALADLIGRRKTIIMGRCFLIASAYYFVTMTNPTDAWIGNILWAIGYVLQSGADTALLYDSLVQQDKSTSYQKVAGQAIGARLILIAFCSLATGFLADVNLRLPLYLSLPMVIIPLLAAILFKEAKQSRSFSTGNQVEILHKGARLIWRSTPIRWMIVFAATISMVSKMWFFTYNPYFELVGVGVAYWGLIFFLLNVVAWLSSHFAHRIEDLLGEGKSIGLMILCLGVPILLMGLVPIGPFAFLVLVQNVVRGFMYPFVTGYLHRHVTSDVRATILSVKSTVSNMASIIGLTTFGYLTDNLGLLPSLTILGTSTLSFGGLLFWLYLAKIRNKTV